MNAPLDRFARPTRVNRAGRIIALAAALAPLAGALADVEIPDFATKGATWSTGLVTHDAVVWDKEFAAWVAAGEKTAHDTVAGNWQLLVRCTFAHCFSGGFVEELKEAATAVPPISNFSANSACKYFETASASEDDADPAKWFSWYALAFKDRAKAGALPGWTLKEITKRAYNAMIDGAVAAIPKNPNIDFEHAQYLSNAADDDLKTGNLRIAILFAGDPERRHINNMDQMRSVLKTQYGFVDANIWIMCGDYGPADAIPNVGWKSSAKATRAELEKALTDAEGFVVKKVSTYANGQALDDKKVKLFIWTTDHGTADAPILMGVDADSSGAAGTGVAAEANPERHLYDAGSSDNEKVMTIPGLMAVNSVSTGYEEVYFATPPDQMPTGRPSLYFSVDRDSWGLADSDVERTLGDFREPAAQVFAVAAGDDNREFIRASAIGLLDDLAADTDDVTALSMTPAAELFNAGMPTHPIFWTRVGSPVIFVRDPWHPSGIVKTYAFWNPVADGWAQGENMPGTIDALGLYVNTDATKRWPMNDPAVPPPLRGNLKWKNGIDAMVFSVPKGDAFDASGCTIFRWNGNLLEVLYSCHELGLDDDDEVDALHAFVKSPHRTRSYGDINDPVPPSSPCAADFDGDGMVDGNDLGTLLGAWMAPGVTDLDGDGVTNGSDLGALLGFWGACP